MGTKISEDGGIICHLRLCEKAVNTICEDSVLLWCEMVTTDVRVWSLLREHDDMPQYTSIAASSTACGRS